MPVTGAYVLFAGGAEGFLVGGFAVEGGLGDFSGSAGRVLESGSGLRSFHVKQYGEPASGGA